jgi:hypothetical protein
LYLYSGAVLDTFVCCVGSGCGGQVWEECTVVGLSQGTGQRRAVRAHSTEHTIFNTHMKHTYKPHIKSTESTHKESTPDL